MNDRNEMIRKQNSEIVNALKKIEQYAKDNFVNEAKKYGTVTTEFGELKRYPNRFVREREHSFSVCYDGCITYRTGGLLLAFEKSHIIGDGYIFDKPSYAKDLIIYWQEVKRKIQAEIDKKKDEASFLSNFEI